MDAQPLYLALCRQCHGADARGYAADHAPSLVNPTFLESATDGFLRRSIVAGRPGTSMGGYGKARGGPLDDAAVDRLVRFLRAQGPAPRALPVTAAGDPAVGAAVYAKRCLSCHGNAQLRGEAVSLVNAGFLADASDAFVRHAIVHGRPGTKMEPFAGALSDAEIDGVVGFLRAQGDLMGMLIAQSPLVHQGLFRGFVQNQELVNFVTAILMVCECMSQVPIDVNRRAVQAVTGQIWDVVLPIQVHTLQDFRN